MNDYDTRESKKGDKMKIVEVKVYPFKNQQGPAKAFASVSFSLSSAGEVDMTWNSLKIVEGNKGLFVAMPTYKVGDDYKGPIFVDWKTEAGKALSDDIRKAVLGAFNGEEQPQSRPQQAFEEDDSDIPF